MGMFSENEYRFLSTDGSTNIHVYECIPEGDARGIVQISHGICEYIGRYKPFARFLAENGYVVVGNDHLGHGLSVSSDDELGFFAEDNGWGIVVDDLEKLRFMTASKWPGLPYFMLGHSMGSFLLRTYLIRYPNSPLKGAILSGTGHQPRTVVRTGKALCEAEIKANGSHYCSDKIHALSLGAYNKGFAPHRTDKDWISRDEALVDEYISDPLCSFMPTVSLYRDMMGGLIFIGEKRNLQKMNKNLPIYIMSGDRDPVGSDGAGVKKVYTLFISAGMNDVVCKLYKDGRHEMLNETNREEVYSDTLRWLDYKNV